MTTASRPVCREKIGLIYQIVFNSVLMCVLLYERLFGGYRSFVMFDKLKLELTVRLYVFPNSAKTAQKFQQI